jgi:hypothetical protein
MSSYIKKIQHPITKKKQDCLCIDDYFGRHRYGYFFRKDGKNADWKDLSQQENFNIFKEDEISL